MFHRHFSTNFKKLFTAKTFFGAQNLPQVFFFTARLCRGSHANDWRFCLSKVEKPNYPEHRHFSSTRGSASFLPPTYPWLRRAQEGCGGLRGENPAAFPQVRPIFQQPFPCGKCPNLGRDRAAGKLGNHFPAASKFAGKHFQ